MAALGRIRQYSAYKCAPFGSLSLSMCAALTTCMGCFIMWSSNVSMLVYNPDARLHAFDKRFNNKVDLIWIGLTFVPHVDGRTGKGGRGDRRTLGIQCQLSAEAKGGAAS
ncbi:hypothetical protein J3459_011046 [Metarhizium acridum]|nr:hypothetical protein J3459_011046 [Metarhizium acridum]